MPLLELFLFIFVSPAGEVKETAPCWLENEAEALAHAEILAKHRDGTIEIWKDGTKLAAVGVSTQGETSARR